MKQIEENSVSGLEQVVIAMVFICIVLFGKTLTACVRTADFIRNWKRREVCQADAGIIPGTQMMHGADGKAAVKPLSAPSGT
jgi:hypothetical protein